jgi:hypothetical protein
VRQCLCHMALSNLRTSQDTGRQVHRTPTRPMAAVSTAQVYLS